MTTTSRPSCPKGLTTLIGRFERKNHEAPTDLLEAIKLTEKLFFGLKAWLVTIYGTDNYGSCAGFTCLPKTVVELATKSVYTDLDEVDSRITSISFVSKRLPIGNSVRLRPCHYGSVYLAKQPDGFWGISIDTGIGKPQVIKMQKPAKH